MIGMVWAAGFDWADGIIARRIRGRTKLQKLFGAQLDSLIDIVSFSVSPAVLLLCYGHFSLWLLPGAFFIVAAGVIRLSYFNVFGMIDKSTYLGLSVDNNVLILAFAFLFSGFVSETMSIYALYAITMALAVLNISSIRTPKLAGRWFYALIVYILVLTTVYLKQCL